MKWKIQLRSINITTRLTHQTFEELEKIFTLREYFVKLHILTLNVIYYHEISTLHTNKYIVTFYVFLYFIYFF